MYEENTKIDSIDFVLIPGVDIIRKPRGTGECEKYIYSGFDQRYNIKEVEHYN